MPSQDQIVEALLVLDVINDFEHVAAPAVQGARDVERALAIPATLGVVGIDHVEPAHARVRVLPSAA